MSTHLISGLHHVTAMAGDAQENLDFYAGVLGMRLVKRSVNQDDPGTYHLFYADGEGAPGSDLTFFPWGKQALPGHNGAGMAAEVSLAVPQGSLNYWQGRLANYAINTKQEIHFAEHCLAFLDPHGLHVTLTETQQNNQTWSHSPVPEKHQVSGLHSAKLLVQDLAATKNFLENTMGFKFLNQEANWSRFILGDGAPGQILDLQTSPNSSGFGAGAIHHLAWRVPNDQAQIVVQKLLQQANRNPTAVIDRFWFKSVYFREPGGAVFEIATDGPGFAVDEDANRLGERLVLPPWLEPHRQEIEAVLPKLNLHQAER